MYKNSKMMSKIIELNIKILEQEKKINALKSELNLYKGGDL